MKISNSILIKVVSEFLLIVLGVSLALAADQWMKTHTEKLQARNTLTRIYHEIKNNREHLIDVINLRQDTINNFDQKLKAINSIDILTATEDEMQRIGYFSPFQPWDAAWKLAESSRDLLRLEYTVALKITAVYSLQESYGDFGHAYMSSVAFNLDYLDEGRAIEARRTAARSIYTLLQYEKSLLRHYENALTSIEDSNSST